MEEFGECKDAGKALGIELYEVPMRTIEESEQAFESMTRAHVAAFLVLASPAAYSKRGARLAELALKYRLPGMFGFEENVQAGGLMSYSADILDLYRRSAAYIDKILKGVNPAELPVEQVIAAPINTKTGRRKSSIPVSTLSFAVMMPRFGQRSR